MMIFRPHRGGLAESMQEAAIFEDADLMLEHIVKIHTDPQFGSMLTKADLSIGPGATEDKRIGWKDCRYVLTSRYGGEEYARPQCIGYCATIFPPEFK